jgi:hypothetical protein
MARHLIFKATQNKIPKANTEEVLNPDSASSDFPTAFTSGNRVTELGSSQSNAKIISISPRKESTDVLKTIAKPLNQAGTSNSKDYRVANIRGLDLTKENGVRNDGNFRLVNNSGSVFNNLPIYVSNVNEAIFESVEKYSDTVLQNQNGLELRKNDVTLIKNTVERTKSPSRDAINRSSESDDGLGGKRCRRSENCKAKIDSGYNDQMRSIGIHQFYELGDHDQYEHAMREQSHPLFVQLTHRNNSVQCSRQLSTRSDNSISAQIGANLEETSPSHSVSPHAPPFQRCRSFLSISPHAAPTQRRYSLPLESCLSKTCVHSLECSQNCTPHSLPYPTYSLRGNSMQNQTFFSNPNTAAETSQFSDNPQDLTTEPRPPTNVEHRSTGVVSPVSVVSSYSPPSSFRESNTSSPEFDNSLNPVSNNSYNFHYTHSPNDFVHYVGCESNVFHSSYRDSFLTSLDQVLPTVTAPRNRTSSLYSSSAKSSRFRGCLTKGVSFDESLLIESLDEGDEQPLDLSTFARAKSFAESSNRCRRPAVEAVLGLDVTQAAMLGNDVTEWAVDDVAKFVAGIPGCGEYIETFRREGIDGASLVRLSDQHLVNYVHMKLGPAVNLRAALDELTVTSRVMTSR